MFIQDTDMIDVKIYYKKDGRVYSTYTENEFKELRLKDDEKKEYNALACKMRELTWGLYNELQEGAMQDDGRGMGERYFNFKIYKEARLARLLFEWDAKDQEGNPAPVNSQTISHLVPAMAETILRGYDEISYLTKEEEKN